MNAGAEGDAEAREDEAVARKASAEAEAAAVGLATRKAAAGPLGTRQRPRRMPLKPRRLKLRAMRRLRSG